MLFVLWSWSDGQLSGGDTCIRLQAAGRCCQVHVISPEITQPMIVPFCRIRDAMKSACVAGERELRLPKVVIADHLFGHGDLVEAQLR